MVDDDDDDNGGRRQIWTGVTTMKARHRGRSRLRLKRRRLLSVGCGDVACGFLLCGLQLNFQWRLDYKLIRWAFTGSSMGARMPSLMSDVAVLECCYDCFCLFLWIATCMAVISQLKDFVKADGWLRLGGCRFEGVLSSPVTGCVSNEEHDSFANISIDVSSPNSAVSPGAAVEVPSATAIDASFGDDNGVNCHESDATVEVTSSIPGEEIISPSTVTVPAHLSESDTEVGVPADSSIYTA
ncbi:hypothetical protein Dimus_028693 [Dionaea muscipula]